MSYEKLVEEYLQLSKQTLAELLALKTLQDADNPNNIQPYILPTQPWPNPTPYTPPINVPYAPPSVPYPWITWCSTNSVQHSDTVAKENYNTSCTAAKYMGEEGFNYTN